MLRSASCPLLSVFVARLPYLKIFRFISDTVCLVFCLILHLILIKLLLVVGCCGQVCMHGYICAWVRTCACVCVCVHVGMYAHGCGHVREDNVPSYKISLTNLLALVFVHLLYCFSIQDKQTEVEKFNSGVLENAKSSSLQRLSSALLASNGAKLKVFSRSWQPLL